MRYAEFLRLLAGRPRRQSTMIFALDGHGGSGKSHFAARLVRCAEQDSPVQPVTLVHMDDFYLPGRLRTPRRGREKPVGGDYDLARLRDTVLRPLAEDQPGAYRRYDWPTDRLAEAHTVPVGGLVVVEGIYTLVPLLRDFYDFSVWVDCPYAIRLARGIARDGEAMRTQWVEDWIPAEDRYTEAYTPRTFARMVVDGSGRVPHDPEATFICIRG